MPGAQRLLAYLTQHKIPTALATSTPAKYLRVKMAGGGRRMCVPTVHLLHSTIPQRIHFPPLRPSPVSSTPPLLRPYIPHLFAYLLLVLLLSLIPSSAHPPSTYPLVRSSTRPPVRLHVCPLVHLFNHTPICLSICPLVQSYTYLLFYLSTCPIISACLFVHLSNHTSICLSICPLVHVSACPPVHS